MDYNQNYPYGRQEKSNVPPQLPEKTNPFVIASLVCGICSVVLCCTGILSVPLGALGILFTILACQKGKSMSPMSITGLVLSIIGLVLGLIMSVYVMAVYLSAFAYGNAVEDGNNCYDYYDNYDDYDFNDHYDDDYNDDYNDYYDDYYDYYRDYFDDYYRDYYDGGGDYFDDFYNYGFENL